MYILNIANTIKKMPVNEISDFICGNYYIQIGFSTEELLFNKTTTTKKDLQLFATELMGKKYLILVMLKNTINHLYERKTQNQ